MVNPTFCNYCILAFADVPRTGVRFGDLPFAPIHRRIFERHGV